MSDARPALRPVDFDPFAPVSAPPKAPLVLTEPQAEMWTAAAMARDANCSYNQCFAFTLEGPLRIESLRAAIDQVVARHDALRVVIAPDGSGQSVRGPFSVEVPLIDLSPLHPEESRRQYDSLLDRECQTPFDLVEGPLVRAFVVRDSPEQHRFVLTAHHLVCDGWSSSLLFSELGRLYAADRVGIPAQLGPAASYSAYVAEQHSRDHVAAAAADEDFWAAQYVSGAPVLDLPLDRPRPATKTYRIGRELLHIDQELYAAVKKTGARAGATLFATLLAAYEVLLFRLSGQADFSVGIPFAGQAQLDNSTLVAHCVSTVPLRARLDPETSFAENLRTVSGDLADAQDHSLVTFGSLVRRLNIPRDRSRTPLVQTLFTIDKLGAAFDFGDVTIASLATPKLYSNFEVAITVVDSGTDLVMECDYNLDLYDSSTLRRWLSHYETLLRGIVARPDDAVVALPVLTDADQRTIIDVWNDTSTAFPEEKRLHRLFEAQVDRTPDAPAVVSGTERVSYRELEQRANQLSHQLRALGVQGETLVGVCLERSVDLVATLLAVLKAGGGYLPLDPDYPEARLAFMVEDSRSSLIVTRRSLADRLAPGQTPLLCLDEQADELAGHPTTSPAPAGTSDGLAYVIYTSGSTGRPNGVAIEHAAAVNHMHWMQTHLPLEPSDRVLQRTPVSFDASVWEVYAPLLAGACIVMAPADPRRATAELTEVIAEQGVTVVQLVPSHARAFLDDPGVEACTGLRRVLCGGEPLPVGVYRELRDRLDAKVVNLYGPTEACIDATWWPVREQSPNGDAAPALEPRGTMPIGRPISNTRAYVLDSRREPVPIGVAGELYLAGAGLARGYLHRDELTADRFVSVSFGGRPLERVYRTGDLVRYRPDGVLEFVGRVDHQVKIRGFRIELGEIEAALANSTEIKDVVVVAREDRPGDKRLVAYVTPVSDASGLADRLKARLRDTLPEYMVPAHVVSLAALPRTPNGKVDRRSLPAPDPEAVTAGRRHVPPRTATESRIAALWADALEIASPGVEDDFFDIGGHSLIAARIVGALRAEFGVDVAMRHLFEQPTIAGLAATVDILAVTAPGAPAAAGGQREEIEL